MVGSRLIQSEIPLFHAKRRENFAEMVKNYAFRVSGEWEEVRTRLDAARCSDNRRQCGLIVH